MIEVNSHAARPPRRAVAEGVTERGGRAHRLFARRCPRSSRSRPQGLYGRALRVARRQLLLRSERLLWRPPRSPRPRPETRRSSSRRRAGSIASRPSCSTARRISTAAGGAIPRAMTASGSIRATRTGCARASAFPARCHRQAALQRSRRRARSYWIARSKTLRTIEQKGQNEKKSPGFARAAARRRRGAAPRPFELGALRIAPKRAARRSSRMTHPPGAPCTWTR